MFFSKVAEGASTCFENKDKLFPSFGFGGVTIYKTCGYFPQQMAYGEVLETQYELNV